MPRSTTDEGELVTDELWGIYFKRDRHGVQGGASPLVVDGDVELDPYPATTDVDPALPRHVVRGPLARDEPLRGLPAALQAGRAPAASARSPSTTSRCSTTCGPNVYTILDSNHGYKMIGVGREVAKVLVGEHSSLLYPFRFERFATGDLHPVSHSPYPWS